MKRIYLSLGSNLGDRRANLDQALAQLPPSGIRVLRVSPIYETEPVDYTTQPWFLNLVIEAETALLPMQLLARIQRIERSLGRVRTTPKGPRTIDIDILLYADSIIRTARLQVPHPGMPERRFVLQPLADLVPDLRHPILHRTIRQLLESAPPQIIKQV